MKYLPTIGLEIHAELKTKTKMFCSCKNDPDEKQPNVNVCPVCLAHPGTLPVINETAVKKVLRAGLALRCQIGQFSQFDRKSYYYPDLPKGYQISQYKYPLCGPGYLEVILDDYVKKVHITRIHLEEDTGRLVHVKKDNYSLVDFNRAGVPLMELVTEPDIQNGQEAKKFGEELQLILRYLNVSDANMEKGQMRCEVNISLKEASRDVPLGTKVEIKNLNSFRAVQQAIDYEIKRQTKILNQGKKVIQETRGWDAKKQKTVSQRIKEEAHDYRYFPEPDLPPLKIFSAPPEKKDIQGSLLILSELRNGIPELPNAKRVRFERDYMLAKEQIEVLVHNKELSEYFEKVASELLSWLKIDKLSNQKKINRAYNLTANYIVTELQKLTKQSKKEETIEKITAENFAELIKMILGNEINSSAAQVILEEMYKTGKDPSDIAQEKQLLQMNDTKEIEKIIDQAIQDNPKVVEDYKKGNENALQFFVGQVMKATKGKANPQTAQEILYNKLSK